MADSSPLAHSPTLQAATPRPAGDDDAHLAAGAAVGDYVVERFLGAGAMGEVYAGTHPVIGKRVAIKVLRLELAASAEAAERFIREARAVNQIDHENVVDVFAFGRLEDGRLYLVMDLVDGSSLRARLVDGALPVGTALAILDTIADALDAAHARGVVHRDLKPDNIMLSNATPSKVMILDFGIAKLISKANEGKPTGPSTLTGAGTWLGTPGYMAPEQWSADGAGPASDRYALGVIAFELLTGTQPFSANSVPAMMEQHFRAKVPAVSTRGAVVPPAVDGVLAKALAKDPDARFPTARAMVDALRAAAGPVAANARGAVAVPVGPRKLWIPAVAGVGLLGGAMVVVVMARSDGTRTPSSPSSSSTKPSAVVAPKGTVLFQVVSTPSGAEVRKAKQLVGTTPATFPVSPGETLELDVRKPGYLPEHRSVAVGAPDASDGTSDGTSDGSSDRSRLSTSVSLVPVQQFEGTWKLTGGELRAFSRRDEQVDVYRLSAVDGERVYMKTYQFALADSGVTFGGDESVSDPRAPSEPSCNVRLRVEYRYDPARDMLEQQRERVSLDFAGGKCIVQARKIEPSVLARVGIASDAHDISAPVGRLEAPEPKTKSVKQKPPTKQAPTKQAAKVLPLDPKAQLQKEIDAKNAKAKTQKTATAAQNAPVTTKKPSSKSGKQSPIDFAEEAQENQANVDNVANPTTPTYTAPKTAPSGSKQNVSPPPQTQVMPQPQASAPQVNEPVPQAPQAPAQQQAPIQKK
jgi:serine/threonine protein kinase